MQPHADQDSRPRVCRRLFAEEVDAADPEDDGVRDNMLNQINEQINRDLDDACKKYNFDFRAEVPLEGNWVWERVAEQPPVPQSREQPEPPQPEPPRDSTPPHTTDQL